jgi:DNA adenine methylase
MAIKPILKYPGAKWLRADWIIAHLPKHRMYVEPYVGSGAIFFNKAQAELEVINDLNKSIVNLFSVIRRRGLELAAQIELTPWARAEYEMVERDYYGTGDELEDARRFLVRCWQAHGTRLSYTSGWRHKGVHGGSGDTVELWNKLPTRILAVIERLKHVEIECRPALDIIARYNAPDVLLYCDPPYPLALRNGAFYAHEMTDSDHEALLEILEAHRGMVALSGYANALYDRRLAHWHRSTAKALTEAGNIREEVLWLNPLAARRAVQPELREALI